MILMRFFVSFQIMATFKANLPTFNVNTIPKSELRDKWNEWVRGFEIQMILMKVSTSADKKIHLLSFGGLDLQNVYFEKCRGTAIGAAQAAGVDVYEEAKQSLTEYFAPKHHAILERHLFCNLRPNEGEKMVQFGQRVETQANKCDFGDTKEEARDNRVIDMIISHSPPELKEELLKAKSLDLDKALKITRQYEEVKAQSLLIAKPSSNIPTTYSSVNKTYDGKECMRCGRKWHNKLSECPALNKKCNVCNRMGHFGVKCRSKGEGTTSDQTGVKRSASSSFRPTKKSKTRQIDSETEKDEVEELYNVGLCDEIIPMKVGGIEIQAFIDSGSKCNMLDPGTWEFLKARGATIQVVQNKPQKKFLGYGRHPLELMGVIEADLKVKKGKEVKSMVDRFYVIKGATQTLLGSVAAKRLGVLHVGLNSTHEEVSQIGTGDETEFPSIKGRFREGKTIQRTIR